MIATVAAWLTTYWLHALTAALAGALGVARLADPRLRERLWRAALVLPLLTASVAVALRAAPEAADRTHEPVPAAALLPAAPVRAEVGTPTELTSPPALPSSPASTPLWASWPAVLSSPTTGRGLAAVWLGIGSLLALGLALDLRRWRRELRARRRVGTRLSTLGGLATPVVVGRDEVCLPERALTELGSDELAAVLAHEEAHIARRDPAWMFGVALLVRLAWAQPLVALVARRWRADVERVCDLAAAGRVGALPLVRGLERVAVWSQGARRPAPLVPAATTTRSALVARVEGVLAPPASARRRTVAAAGVGVVALAAALGCVGVGPRAEVGVEAGDSSSNEVATAVALSAEHVGELPSPAPRFVVGIDVARERYSLGDAEDLDEAGLRDALRKLYEREPDGELWLEPDRDISIPAFNRVVWCTIDAGFTHIDSDIARIGTELPEPLRERILEQVVGHLGSGLDDVRVSGDGQLDLWVRHQASARLSDSFVERNRDWLAELVEMHDTWLLESHNSAAGTHLVWHLAEEADVSCVLGAFALGRAGGVDTRRMRCVAGGAGETSVQFFLSQTGQVTGQLAVAHGNATSAETPPVRDSDRALALSFRAGQKIGEVIAQLSSLSSRGKRVSALIEEAQ